MLARAATEIVLIATLIVVTEPLGLVAALSIIVISCHLGGAGLVPRRFKLLFRVLVAKARNVSISVVSCHLGGAGLVPQRFKLLFQAVVAKAHNVLDFLFGSWLRCQVVSHF